MMRNFLVPFIVAPSSPPPLSCCLLPGEGCKWVSTVGVDDRHHDIRGLGLSCHPGINHQVCHYADRTLRRRRLLQAEAHGPSSHPPRSLHRCGVWQVALRGRPACFLGCRIPQGLLSNAPGILAFSRETSLLRETPMHAMPLSWMRAGLCTRVQTPCKPHASAGAGSPPSVAVRALPSQPTDS
jgi:hypothetical protein